MPKDSLNIYMTIQDGMSPVLASITDKTKVLDKETRQLQQTTNAMTKASQSLPEKSKSGCKANTTHPRRS